MLSSASDIDLWNASVQGDRKAFGELFRRHYSFLFFYGAKICSDKLTIEDSIQELFTELWQKKPSQPVQSVRAYLLQALKFKLYRAFRDEKSHQEISDNGNEPFEISHDSFLILQEDDQRKMKQVVETINQLPPRQKEVIYLKIYKGLSYEEVSAVMGINYQVVRNLLCQALKTFRKLLVPVVIVLTTLNG